MAEKNKDYQLSAAVQDGILEIVMKGEVTNHNLESLRADVIVLMRNHHVRAVLVDVYAMKGRSDIATAYFRVRSIPLDIKKIPVAIVEASGNEEFQSFYETTAANTGATAKFFTDINAARAWLTDILSEMK